MASAKQQGHALSTRQPDYLPSIGGEDPDFVLGQKRASIMCIIPDMKLVLPSWLRRFAQLFKISASISTVLIATAGWSTKYMKQLCLWTHDKNS